MEKRSPARNALLEKAKSLTTTSGVYLMKHASGHVLYVGKAKSLRSRVSSYFQPITHDHPRTELMLQLVQDFEVILTETESEALILECTLIKRHKPKYNVMLKDDKHYPYIKIPSDVDFPRLEWTRKVKADGARYFGPFPSSYSARTVLRLLTEHFRLRDCSDNTFSHRSRPCILYQMDQCSAPCVLKVDQKQYRQLIDEAVRVLEGKGDELIADLKLQMQELSDEERFEDAARVRDQIESIQIITETQSVSQEDQQLDRDVFAFERSEPDPTMQGQGAHAVVLQVRRGKLLSVRHYRLFNVDSAVPDSEIMFDFLAQHFLLNSENDSMVRSKIVLMHGELDQDAENRELLEKTLEIQITNPKTEAEKQLVNVAHTNAKHALKQGGSSEGGHGFGALEDVQDKLGLDRLPRRIECYDVSNTQGEDSVASRVVFVDGSPEKNLYRRYKIKTVIGANDFASLREIMERRFSQMNLRAGDERPDLVLIDGGKGQLAQAEAIFADLNIQGVAIAGLAKARTESDFKSKEVAATMERIFLPNRVNPVNLFPNTQAFKLLTHLRDEAHRFALAYHRNLRDKI